MKRGECVFIIKKPEKIDDPKPGILDKLIPQPSEKIGIYAPVNYHALSVSREVVPPRTSQSTPRELHKPPPPVQEATTGKQETLSDTIVFPSVGALYDDDQITAKGMNIAEARRNLQREPMKDDLIRNLETALFIARIKYIKEHAEGETERRLMEELAKVTYVTAYRLQYDELRETAVQMIYKLYPNKRRASQAIENLRIKMEWEDRNKKH